MEIINKLLHSSVFFWAAWITIPLIMEIIPTVGDFFILLRKKIHQGKKIDMTFMPEITLIVPVYNSEDSLYRCIESIAKSHYDLNQIYVLLVNNMSKDNSFKVFCQCQEEFKDLNLNWVNSKQGKSKALNLALFNSEGKYIIHIDSDGILHPDALKNMVQKFESDESIDSMTGIIMTNPAMIDQTPEFFMRLLRKNEFFEYCQAFLAGRNFQSELNNIFTLSGAFSAFRRSTILSTQLYNTDTVCEDTHVTFQIRDNQQGHIVLCNDAIFFVDPIEDINRLYIQRQRWQQGEVEVMHMFQEKNLNVKGFFKNFAVRLVAFDHTFAFPRMIWYFALLCLCMSNYPLTLVIKAIIIMYLLYVSSTCLLYFCILLYLRPFKELLWYYGRKFYLIFTLPMYNSMVFWFRFAGIINSLQGERSWKLKNFTEEKGIADGLFKKDFHWFFYALDKARGFVNVRETVQDQEISENTQQEESL